MKRSFKFIVSILVVILCISSFSLMLDVFKDDDKSSGNRSPSVIVPIDPDDTEEPEEPEEPSPEAPEPVRIILSDEASPIPNLGKNTHGAIELDDDGYLHSSAYSGINGKEYADFALTANTNGIKLSDYSKIEISFDYYDRNDNPLGCAFYLSGRDIYNVGLKSALSNIEVSSIGRGEDSGEYFCLTTSDGYECESDIRVSVKYIIEIDENNPSNSMIRIYLNGTEYLSGVPLFTSAAETISSIRFTKFNTGSLDYCGFMVENLLVVAYE